MAILRRSTRLEGLAVVGNVNVPFARVLRDLLEDQVDSAPV
jgi:hypothetical protein